MSKSPMIFGKITSDFWQNREKYLGVVEKFNSIKISVLRYNENIKNPL